MNAARPAVQLACAYASVIIAPSAASRSMLGVLVPINPRWYAPTSNHPMSSARIRSTFGLSVGTGAAPSVRNGGERGWFGHCGRLAAPARRRHWLPPWDANRATASSNAGEPRPDRGHHQLELRTV